jgi:PqqD family protein of HPr-rel-A system
MSSAPGSISRDLPHKRSDLQEQRVGDDLMVYDPVQQKVHVLNPTAALIFRLSDGQHDLDSLEHELRHGFAISREQDLRSDILAAIESLREKGLLR